MHCSSVVPLAGTWIETLHKITPYKYSRQVVPLAGTWIETALHSGQKKDRGVVPLAGTWIETRCDNRSDVEL